MWPPMSPSWVGAGAASPSPLLELSPPHGLTGHTWNWTHEETEGPSLL